VVIDTGIDHQAVADHEWLRRVTGRKDPAIRTTVGGQRVLVPYAGHGTFIAGIIRTMAPQAQVRVRADFGHCGAVLESTLALALETVVRRNCPDIINLAAGVRSDLATGPLALQTFYENVLSKKPGVVVVAAAGNDNSDREFWPAATAWATGVGALTADGHAKAEFSNYGSWVDVYTLGDKLINAFPTGSYTYTEPPNQGTVEFASGMAQWCGTSFATAIVTGLIAQRMSTEGLTSVEARDAVLGSAQHLAGLGKIVLPG
jgi:subtilisin family serine protease